MRRKRCSCQKCETGAALGEWAYRFSNNSLIDPSEFVDFMSYCDPSWVSDWSFIKLFKLIDEP